MSNKPRPDATWTDERCTELQRLERLLREVSSINSGSHCLERIARCMELSDALTRTDFSSGRPSFLQWLTELAMIDRFPPQG